MPRLIRNVRVSTLALIAGSLATIGAPASAQLVEGQDFALADDHYIETNVDVEVERAIADDIQQNFVDDQLEAKYGDEFDQGVLTVVRAAYAQSLFEPLWTRDAATSLAKAPDLLEENGIYLSASDRLFLEQTIDARLNGTREQRAEADIRLTFSWLKMASTLSDGLASEGKATDASEDRPAQPLLLEKLVDASGDDPLKELSDYEPDIPQYAELKKARSIYRDDFSEITFTPIADGEALEPGVTDPRVPELRQRLNTEGYKNHPDVVEFLTSASEIKADSPEELKSEISELLAEQRTVYDANLETAVKRFQKQHGLEPDGVVGPKTLNALNEPASVKLKRIDQSLAAIRDMGPMPERMVWLNVPSYTAEGWADGKREIAMKTIVGLPSRATPIFSDDIEYIVANPKWYVPSTIFQKDKLPKLNADPAYASRNGYTVYDRSTGQVADATMVNWSEPSVVSQYQMVQNPGANNALGELKIIFPNRHSVYMHGTPSEHLFDRVERAKSSGCIRLEHPVKMAQWLAGHSTDVSADEVASTVAAKTHKRFDFQQTTPVEITYITVTVDERGQPVFWRDIYGLSDTDAVAEENLFGTPDLMIAKSSDEDKENEDYAALDTESYQRAG